jgi:probable rRNA maturation factor
MAVKIYHRKNSPVQIKKVQKCLEKLLRFSGRQKAELELRLVGLKNIQKLNRKFLNKNRITDVLSFPLETHPPFKNGPWHLGEIVIATEIAKRQAKKASRALTTQIIRLAIHGFVHLHGLDHETGEGELKKFQRLEKKYLQYLSKKGCVVWDGSLQF